MSLKASAIQEDSAGRTVESASNDFPENIWRLLSKYCPTTCQALLWHSLGLIQQHWTCSVSNKHPYHCIELGFESLQFPNVSNPRRAQNHPNSSQGPPVGQSIWLASYCFPSRSWTGCWKLEGMHMNALNPSFRMILWNKHTCLEIVSFGFQIWNLNT